MQAEPKYLTMTFTLLQWQLLAASAVKLARNKNYVDDQRATLMAVAETIATETGKYTER